MPGPSDHPHSKWNRHQTDLAQRFLPAQDWLEEVEVAWTCIPKWSWLRYRDAFTVADMDQAREWLER